MNQQAAAIIIAGALLAVAAMMVWRFAVTRAPCSADVAHRHYVFDDSPAQCCDPNGICWNED
jgi:hypothetical protein